MTHLCRHIISEIKSKRPRGDIKMGDNKYMYDSIIICYWIINCLFHKLKYNISRLMECYTFNALKMSNKN